MARRRYRRRYRRRSTFKRNIVVAGRGRHGFSRTVSAIPRGLALKKHHFKQTYHPLYVNYTSDVNVSYTQGGAGAAGSGTLYGPTITSAAAAGYFSFFTTLAELPQVSQFTNIFDAYRINKVVFKFIPLSNNVNLPQNTPGNLAAAPQWLSTVIDYDDSSILTTEGSMLEYESFKQTAPYRRHTRSFVPALAIEAYKTSGTTIAYSQARKKWIDAAYTDVPHYGVKGLVNGPAIQADQVQCAWKVYCTMYVSFKQTR